MLFLLFVGAFVAQVATRVRLIAAGTGAFSLDRPAFRVTRFLFDVLLQRQTIRERPAVGVAHALVFWGFVAFAGYTLSSFSSAWELSTSRSLGAFRAYRAALVPFAAAVLVGIIALLVRRVAGSPGRARRFRVPRVRGHRAVHCDADGDVSARVQAR